MIFRLIAGTLLYVLSAAKFRFPQFNKVDLSYDERINTTRLMAINTFVEEFRGWEDESPDLPDEFKVINVTSDIYKKQIVNSKTPWILAFIKR